MIWTGIATIEERKKYASPTHTAKTIKIPIAFAVLSSAESNIFPKKLNSLSVLSFVWPAFLSHKYPNKIILKMPAKTKKVSFQSNLESKKT